MPSPNSHDNMNYKFKDNIIWILDSGASYHMNPLRSIVQRFKRIDKPLHIITLIGDSILIEIMEDVNLSNDFF